MALLRQNEKLEALAKYHEDTAQAIRRTIEVLNGSETSKARAKFNGTLKTAIQTRASGKKSGNGLASAGLHGKALMARLVSALDRKKPTALADVRAAIAADNNIELDTRALNGPIGNLINHGYVKKHGKKGYVLTKKQYQFPETAEPAATEA